MSSSVLRGLAQHEALKAASVNLTAGTDVGPVAYEMPYPMHESAKTAFHEALARAYCEPGNRHKELDGELLKAAADQAIGALMTDSRLHALMIHALATACHNGAKKFWTDLETGAPKKRNVGEMLMLAVSELAEAMEGDRKGCPDTHLPQYPMIDVEIADTLIRLFDLIGGLKLLTAQAFVDKRSYNETRADHTREARLADGGKKY